MYDTIEERIGGLPEVCTKHRVRSLALFGSVLSDRFDPTESDVDVLVEFGEMPISKRAHHYFGLQEDLEQLFGFPVDIVEPSALDNPYLKKSIEQSRLVVYEAV